MELKRLRQVIEDAARLFSASGAAPQAKALTSVAEVLRVVPDKTAAEFADRTLKSLAEADVFASFSDLPPEHLVVRLRELDQDKPGFERLLAVLKSKAVSTDKAIKVAGNYTGMGDSAFKSKQKALKAIEDKFRERAFQASKARLNERVSPY